jgi:3-dehydroquinate dehydratase/shikimate dehydrogenase
MFTLVIQGTFENAIHLLKHASFYIEVFEIRLDLIEDISLEKLSILRHLTPKKILFTLRTKKHGGHYEGSFKDYCDYIFSILPLHPDYIDIEIEATQQLLDKIKTLYPSVKIVLSSHHFDKATGLSQAFSNLLSFQADVYKLAISGDVLEALKMLLLTKKTVEKGIAFTGIVMGKEGVLSRLLSKIVGNYFIFCSATPNFLGQLTIEEMVNIYHIHKTSKETKVFGLIGNPVTASPSHITHNRLFENLGLDAIYVKIFLEENQLSSFLMYAKALFDGLSITAPFKEKILEFVNIMSSEAKNIGAINTLKKKSVSWVGENTDRLGAYKALSNFCALKNKNCLVVGCGGAAKAIIYELLQHSAEVTVLNRSEKKQKLSMKQYTFNDIFPQLRDKKFDILIQATSCELHGDDLPESILDFLEDKPLVFETIITPKYTNFLNKSLQKGCFVIEGYHMFLHQAAYQFKFWFELDEDESILYEKLKSIYLSFACEEVSVKS